MNSPKIKDMGHHDQPDAFAGGGQDSDGSGRTLWGWLRNLHQRPLPVMAITTIASLIGRSV